MAGQMTGMKTIDVEGDARAHYIRESIERDWTSFVRLRCQLRVSQYTAMKHLEEWAWRLTKELIPGSAVMVGLHTDTDGPHGHGLVFLPQRFMQPIYPKGIMLVGGSNWPLWFEWCWGRGDVWVAPYRPQDFRPGGAASYLSKELGNVVRFGSAPLRQRRRR
jgi:hypothetical protein